MLSFYYCYYYETVLCDIILFLEPVVWHQLKVKQINLLSFFFFCNDVVAASMTDFTFFPHFISFFSFLSRHAGVCVVKRHSSSFVLCCWDVVSGLWELMSNFHISNRRQEHLTLSKQNKRGPSSGWAAWAGSRSDTRGLQNKRTAEKKTKCWHSLDSSIHFQPQSGFCCYVLVYLHHGLHHVDLSCESLWWHHHHPTHRVGKNLPLKQTWILFIATSDEAD